MYGACRLFFTCTGLAGNIDGYAAGRQAADEVADFNHLRRAAEQTGHIGFCIRDADRYRRCRFGEFRRHEVWRGWFRRNGRFGDFVLVFGNGNGRLDEGAELREGNRLLDVVERAATQGFLCLIGIAEGGDDGNRRIEQAAVDVLDDFEPGAVRHTHIGQDERIALAVELVFGFGNA